MNKVDKVLHTSILAYSILYTQNELCELQKSLYKSFSDKTYNF